MKKIAILHPKGDDLAEKIALKLMLNFDDWVYVVGQRFSKPEIIRKRLEKIKSAFFIWFNPKINIDKDTKKYLEFLIEKNKKIFAILHEDFIFPYQAEKIERYNPDNVEDTFRKIYSIIGEIGELIKKPKKHRNYENIVLRAFIPILLISLKLKKFSRKNSKNFSKISKNLKSKLNTKTNTISIIKF